jgi:hypothetical protein
MIRGGPFPTASKCKFIAVKLIGLSLGVKLEVRIPSGSLGALLARIKRRDRAMHKLWLYQSNNVAIAETGAIVLDGNMAEPLAGALEKSMKRNSQDQK